MSAKIKHIGIISDRPGEQAKFYEAVFGAQIAGPRRAGDGAPEEAPRRPQVGIFTDGYVGVNINRRNNGQPAGLNHWGLAIESLEDVQERLNRLYPQVEIITRPELPGGIRRPFARFGSHDIEGNIFDLSPQDLDRHSVYAESEEGAQHTRHISHIMLPALDAARLAKFYTDVYDFEELEKASSDANFYLFDGKVTMVIHPWKLSEFTGALDGKPCIDHLGWKVDDMDRFLEDVERVSAEHPEMTPKPYEGEAEKRREKFSACSLGKHFMSDMDGVLIDVSDH